VNESMVVHVLDTIRQTSSLYFKLVIILAPSGGGKTNMLHEVGKAIGASVINVNLEISRMMLDLTQQQRILQAPQLLDKIVSKSNNDVVLLDNIELLFDTRLRLDPLALLKKISRDRIVVTSWNGYVEDNRLNYARQGHPEYGSYELGDIIVISLA
jgi:oligoribonuclease NrnB/cAMP/cGMP phosphodiesterase (DHH superfamily)